MNGKILEDLGFTKSEIKVYLALLELGESSSGNIIKKSKVSRSKVYDVLNKLKDKGLVSEIKRDKFSYFRSLSPNRILDYLSEREEKMKNQRTKFENLLPELLEKEEKSSSDQEVKVYIGIRGFKTFYRELIDDLSDNDEYLGLAYDNMDSNNMNIILMFHKFFKERGLRGGRTKLLARFKKQLPSDIDVLPSNYEFRWVNGPLPTIAGIYLDTIVIFSWGDEPKIFSIKCAKTASDYREYFYSLWEKAKR